MVITNIKLSSLKSLILVNSTCKQSQLVTGNHENSLEVVNVKKTSMEVPNDINTHFAGICSSLPSLNLCGLTPYLLAVFSPAQVTREQIYKRLRWLNSSKAKYPGDCPTRFLKEFAYELSTHIFSAWAAFLEIGKGVSVHHTQNHSVQLS